jgi:hypothetical protein
MKTKTLDCVETKRKGSEKVYQMIKDMTREEEIEFWRRGNERLKKEIEERKRAKASMDSQNEN